MTLPINNVRAPKGTIKTVIPAGVLHHVRVHFNRRLLAEYNNHIPRRPWRLGPMRPYDVKLTILPTFGEGYYSVGYYDKDDHLIVVLGPRYLTEESTMLAEWDGSLETTL